MLLVDPDRLIRNQAGLYPELACALLQRFRGGRRPQPAELRQARTFLSGVPDVPVKISLSPTVCKSLAVVEMSYQVRLPDTFAPGSLFRGDQEVKNAMNPHIDVTIAQDVTGGGRIFATHAIIEAATDRLAGAQHRTSKCESCWVIDFCDNLYFQFFLERALAASEVPLEVIVSVYGFGLGCNLDDVNTDAAKAMLTQAGYLSADGMPITTGGG